MRAANQRYHALRRVVIDEFKDVPCAVCGVKYPPRAMDLHHPRGVAKPYKGASLWAFAIASSLTTLTEHLQKLTVLCANCHRIHHWVTEPNPQTHNERIAA